MNAEEQEKIRKKFRSLDRLLMKHCPPDKDREYGHEWEAGLALTRARMHFEMIEPKEVPGD